MEPSFRWEVFQISFFITIFLFLFFETEGFLKWLEYFKVARFLPHYKNYKEIIDSGGSVKYLIFLRKSDKNIFVQLITCPVCLSVWVSFTFALFFGIKYYPFINFFCLLKYFSLKILHEKSNSV